MKLPVDPKMRTQLMILVGVGAVVLLVLGYFGLSFLLTQRAESKIKLDAATLQLEKIQAEIKALPDLRQSRDELFGAIQLASTKYILFHEYRNYHLTAREILLPLAAELNIVIDIPKKGPSSISPSRKQKAQTRPARRPLSSLRPRTIPVPRPRPSPSIRSPSPAKQASPSSRDSSGGSNPSIPTWRFRN